RLRRFVADASHELRTPLAAVSAYAELFERGARAQPEDLARVMAGVRSETARMGLLVEDLLLLARLDEGRPLERRPVELVRVAASTAAPAWGSRSWRPSSPPMEEPSACPTPRAVARPSPSGCPPTRPGRHPPKARSRRVCRRRRSPAGCADSSPYSVQLNT